MELKSTMTSSMEVITHDKQLDDHLDTPDDSPAASFLDTEEKRKEYAKRLNNDLRTYDAHRSKASPEDASS